VLAADEWVDAAVERDVGRRIVADDRLWFEHADRGPALGRLTVDQMTLVQPVGIVLAIGQIEPRADPIRGRTSAYDFRHTELEHITNRRARVGSARMPGYAHSLTLTVL
jgi:hypothetical protein